MRVEKREYRRSASRERVRVERERERGRESVESE